MTDAVTDALTDAASTASIPADGGSRSSGRFVCHGVDVEYRDLPRLTLAFLTHAGSQEGTYSWEGGHGDVPGPSYGRFDGTDEASRHDDEVIGLDCSGLVRLAYALTTGHDLLRGVTDVQWATLAAIDADGGPHRVVARGSGGPDDAVEDHAADLRVGDVLFYGPDARHHVSVHLGAGLQVHASQSGLPYGVTPVGRRRFWGAVRLW